MVLFIDQPQSTAPTGIYGVPLTGGEEQLVSERIGLPSPDGRYRAYLSDNGETIVEPIDSSTRWVIPNGGLRVFFSPNSERLAWAAIPQSGNFDERPAVISISDIDGSDPAEIITIYGGGIGGWLDDDHLLLVGRDRGQSQDVALFSLSVIDGTRTDLITNQRIRSVQIAPGGGWVSYTISLNTDDSVDDGLWVIRADGGERYKLEVAGAARWRDATHLLLIPYEVGAESHRLWEFSTESGQAYPLTDPTVTPFKVSAGDWSVSPDGKHLVFLSDDQSLWVLTIPDSPAQD
jgi:Tol biopolymer transport system component